MFVAVSFFTISPQAAMWVLHNESLDLCKNTRTIITILSHIHPLSTIKGKLKEKGREMQIQDNTKTCYGRGN